MTSPATLQHGATVQELQERFRRFEAALQRYPQHDDPDVIAVRNACARLQLALRTECARACCPETQGLPAQGAVHDAATAALSKGVDALAIIHSERVEGLAQSGKGRSTRCCQAGYGSQNRENLFTRGNNSNGAGPCSQTRCGNSGTVFPSVPDREPSVMIAIQKRSSQTIIAGSGRVPIPGAKFDQDSVDPEVFQRQCAQLEHNEEAAEQRARENEYWRQRTLARKMHVQEQPQTAPDLKSLVRDDHALETMGSKHRIGEMLNVFMDRYNQLRPSQLFLDWVDSLTPMAQVKLIQKAVEDSGHMGVFKPEWVRAFNRSVCYMYAAARRSYQIQIRNGLLYQNGALFDTDEMKTELSGVGVAIFVQSADGIFYSSNHVWNRVHHSSFTSDTAIRSAGEWQVRQGKIAWISGQCGHYEPTMDQLVTAIEDLGSRNALHQCKARVFDCRNSMEAYIDASSLVSNSRCFQVGNTG